MRTKSAPPSRIGRRGALKRKSVVVIAVRIREDRPARRGPRLHRCCERHSPASGRNMQTARCRCSAEACQSTRDTWLLGSERKGRRRLESPSQSDEPSHYRPKRAGPRCSQRLATQDCLLLHRQPRCGAGTRDEARLDRQGRPFHVLANVDIVDVTAYRQGQTGSPCRPTGVPKVSVNLRQFVNKWIPEGVRHSGFVALRHGGGSAAEWPGRRRPRRDLRWRRYDRGRRS